MYDADTKFQNEKSELLVLEKQDFQGSMECTLAEICGSAGKTLTKPLVNPRVSAGMCVGREVGIRPDSSQLHRLFVLDYYIVLFCPGGRSTDTGFT